MGKFLNLDMIIILILLIKGDIMIISASFLKIQKEKENILKLDKYADYMHYDVMDGQFTPSITPSLVDIKAAKPKDVHLMVRDIKKYVDEYSKINPEYITFHVEATSDVIEMINYIKSKKIKVGLALNPETKVESIIPYLKYVSNTRKRWTNIYRYN